MFKPMFSLFLALAQATGPADRKAVFSASQDCFDSEQFLQLWNNSDFTMQSQISQAFTVLKNNYKHEIEARKVYICLADASALSEKDTSLVDKNLISYEKEEQALARLASPHLALDHIRIMYKTNNGHACAYLQLENSFCWHAGNLFPTIYRRNEKILKQQETVLKQLIGAHQKPRVTVHLSSKAPLASLFSQSQKILYTLDVDFTKDAPVP